MRVWTRQFVFASLVILCLSLASPSSVHAANQAAAPSLVPTTVCTCQPEAGYPSTGAHPRAQPGPPPPSTTAYDEQIGITFTQSFTALEYNVTAVEQADPVLGTGPGYLLNGLSNTGYWYQVGLSWDWSPGQTPGTGFDMNYEVFDPSQNSIFPSDGGGGVLSFTGTVNEGDAVLLNLYFTNSSRVVMAAEDTSTGAFASETYTAFGATFFAGLQGSVANPNGYFTGLMTEWYHGNPFYANGKQVIYSDPNFALTSAWMWMDEFNANTMQDLFSTNTSSPVTYSDPTHLQEFSYNGTVEYSDAFEFITGNLTGTSTNTRVPLTLSYSVQGGGTGYAPPVIKYVSDGVQTSATLNSSAVTYEADVGSSWSVQGDLNGSSANQRWQTNQPTTGVVNSSQAIDFQYHHQYQITFGFSVSGGGARYSSPTVAYASFGSSQSVTIPTGISGENSSAPGVWADAGARYNYTDPLPGSSSGERWNAALPSGTVDSAATIAVSYYHQFMVSVQVSFKGSEVFPSVALRSTGEGSQLTGTLVQGTTSFWLDSQATYSAPQTLSLSQGERWATNSTTAGMVSSHQTISLVYQYQYYVSIEANSADGGVVSSSSGWYVGGTNLQATATPSSGWTFEGWTGVGQGSSSSPSGTLSLLVKGPANETATFYPGVSLTSRGPISVSYQDGSISGTVPAGTSSVIYVPPSSTISLRASSAPFLFSFTGWSGASSSTGASISIAVNGPESLAADSSYNYTSIVIIVLGVVVLIILGVLLASRRSRKPAGGGQKKTVGSPAA